MGKNKEYNPKELDTIQEAYNKSDEMEKKKAKFRKQENIKKRRDENEERLEVKKDIIKRYGSNKVKDENLIKKGITDIYPRCCMGGCKEYKIYPFEFLTATGYDNDKSNCSKCMADLTKRVKKYKDEYKKNNIVNEIIECPCGKCIILSDLERHNGTLGHINGVAQLRIKGLNKIVKIKDMRKIASLNKISSYYKKKMEDIIKELVKLENVIIPEEFK